MSVDPEQDPTAEPQDALDPQTDESSPDDELGDAGKTKGGSDFITPIVNL